MDGFYVMIALNFLGIIIAIGASFYFALGMIVTISIIIDLFEFDKILGVVAIFFLFPALASLAAFMGIALACGFIVSSPYRIDTQLANRSWIKKL